jgi:hypothetical protein
VTGYPSGFKNGVRIRLWYEPQNLKPFLTVGLKGIKMGCLHFKGEEFYSQGVLYLAAYAGKIQ